MNQEKIGRLIAELRKEKNMTQNELGKKLGVTKNAVSKWERGLCLMDMSLLEPLCNILDISIVELLNGEKKGQTENEIEPQNIIMDTINYSVSEIKREKKYMRFMIIVMVPLTILSLIFIDTIFAVISKSSPLISIKVNDKNDKDSYVSKGVLIDVYYCVEGNLGDVVTVIPTFKNTNYSCPNR